MKPHRHFPHARIGRSAIGLVMAVLLVAALSKLADVTAFANELKEWHLLPDAAAPLLAVIVPALEIGLATAWFLGLGRRRATLLALLTIGAFSGLYGAHALLGEPPACACFGKWMLFKEAQQSSLHVLGRNGLLMAFLVTGFFLARREFRRPVPTRQPA